MSQMPANAPLSDDGQWWWDGTQWQPVPEMPAIPGVVVQHGQTPHEIEMPPDGGFNDKTMTVEPGFIKAVCDYAGIPDSAGTYQIVRQQLENDFFSVYEGVRAQLENAKGGDHVSQIGWEHDARVEEQRLYKEDGEKAWKEAYDASAPR